MFIPKDIKVRVRNEKDVEIPLAYITYTDEKGNLRSLKSWQQWGNGFLGDFSNSPKSGFRLEKSVQRSRDWFGTGRTLFRIQHPDNFIFEITANNMVEICKEINIEKGEFKDDCVLAWNGASLALIPCSTDDYKEHTKHTELLVGGHVKSKDLVIGRPYNNKNNKFEGFYIGKISVIVEIPTYKKVPNPNHNYSSWSSSREINKYVPKFVYKTLHIFVRGDSNKLSNTHYTSPNVYECDKTDLVFNSEWLDENKIQSSFYRWRMAYLIPKQLKGNLDQEKIQEWILKNVKDPKYVEHILDWSTFPKKIS